MDASQIALHDLDMKLIDGMEYGRFYAQYMLDERREDQLQSGGNFDSN